MRRKLRVVIGIFVMALAALCMTQSAQAQTAIYYSVGTNTSSLYSANASASSGTLTLNDVAADNVGVGDQIRRDADRFYITGRNSSTEFTIQDSNANSGTPGDSDITFSEQAITIYRAFNSLNAAEANSGNSYYLNNYNISSGGGNYQLNWACYGDATADNTTVDIDSYTTSVNNYIRVYTPVDSSEVGTSQRHNGVWSTSGYRLDLTPSDPAIDITGSTVTYVWLDGLQVSVTASSGANYHGIRIDPTTTPNEIKVSNCIVRGVLSGTTSQFAAIIMRQDGVSKLWNNIVYDWWRGGNTHMGIIIGSSAPATADMYCYNNTVYNSFYGIRAQEGEIYAKNNIVINPGGSYWFSVFNGSFSGTSTNNAYGGGSDPGIGGISLSSNTAGDYFVSTSDFHIDSSGQYSSQIISAGDDLDDDSDIAVTDDIDGQARHASTPDVGADEHYATAIYYSVGTNTSSLYSANASAANGVLSLNDVAADNVGVGDEIRRDADRFYITGRNSSTEFTIQESNANSGTPGDSDITFSEQAITIYRAFNTLNDAEDNCGNSSYLNTDDLTGASDYQLNWPCYADGTDDTTLALVSGWTTDSDSYIKIYTPTETSEVGASQRHTGVAGTGYVYAPTVSSGNVGMLEINAVGYTRVEGLDIDGKNLSNIAYLRGIFPTSIPLGEEIYISHNIVHDLSNATAATALIEVRAIQACGDYTYIHNNIVYDIDNNYTASDSRCYGIVAAQSTDYAYAYNNTVLNVRATGGYAHGISGAAGYMEAKNNYVGDVDSSGSTEACFSSLDVEQYNVSSDSTATGTGSKNGKTAYSSYFKNTGSGTEDFHLKADSNALWGGYGADLDQDQYIAVTDDIDGDARDSSTPDIGADEYSPLPGTVMVVSKLYLGYIQTIISEKLDKVRAYWSLFK